MKKETKRSENDQIKNVVVTMVTAAVIVAGVAAMLRLSKVMITDLKGMGL